MISASEIDIYSQNNKLLLKNINIEANSRDIIAISGPNGCGKSTLLRNLAGLEGNQKGITRKISLSEISYIPTRPLDLLLPWATVNYNTNFFRGDKICQSIDIFFDTIQYKHSDIKNIEVYKLSSGQQCLVALFCALLNDKKLLICDEIFSSLSVVLRKNIANLLKNSCYTIILTMHDVNFVRDISAKIINVDNNIVE